jgi:hypothetical protein
MQKKTKKICAKKRVKKQFFSKSQNIYIKNEKNYREKSYLSKILKILHTKKLQKSYKINMKNYFFDISEVQN